MAASSSAGGSQVQHVQTTVFKFDGRSNFAMWKRLMELCLKTSGYGEIIKDGFTEPTEGDKGKADMQQVDKNRLLNEKALFLICQSVELSVLEKIFYAKTAKEAWEILLKTYEGADLVKRTRLQGLKRQFELMEQGREESIRDYFSRMDKLVNEMKNNGDDIKEKEVMEKIMRTLSTRFDYVVAAIEEAKDLSTMTLNDLQASLESREMRMNERSSGTVEQALKAQTNVRNEGPMQRRENRHQRGQNFNGKWRNSQSDLSKGTRGNGSFQNKSNIQCHKCQKYGHFQSECKSHIKCHNCNKYGHYSRECRTKTLNIRESHAQVAEGDDDMKMVLTTSHAATDNNNDQWLLDTGCSNHLSGKKELFSDLDESYHTSVKLGDNSKLEVLGKGKIAIRLKDGSLNYISDVFYAPGICQNLLSVGQLVEKGYDLKFNKKGCTINDAEMGLIAKTNMSRNRLFPMNIRYDADLCCKVVAVDDNWLWHMRFGHFNFESIKFLANKI